MLKLKIQRAFSKKVQVRQFEPIESFCAVEGEYDIPDEDSGINKLTDISSMLDNFCRIQVERTISMELYERKQVDKAKSKDVGIESAQIDYEAERSNTE